MNKPITKDDLKEILTQLPIDLLAKESDLLRMIQEREDIEEKISAIESQTGAKIMEMSTIEEFKNSLSNEAKRKTKLMDMLQQNTEYVAAARLHMQLRKEIAQKELSIRFLDRQFKAYRSVVLLTTN